MNKTSFMNRLKELLSDITEAEREEALSYYEEYLNDAGEENEESVIASLGSPESVAETIKRGLNGADESGEYTEAGYFNDNTATRDEIVNRTMTDEERGFGKKQQWTGSMIVLFIVIAVFALPVLGPLVVGVIGLIIGLICAVIGILSAVFIAGAAIAITGFVLLVSGAIVLFAEPLVGFFVIGGGLILTGIGLMIATLGGWIIVKAIPPMIRGFVDLCRLPFRGRARA